MLGSMVDVHMNESCEKVWALQPCCWRFSSSGTQNWSLGT